MRSLLSGGWPGGERPGTGGSVQRPREPAAPVRVLPSHACGFRSFECVKWWLVLVSVQRFFLVTNDVEHLWCASQPFVDLLGRKSVPLLSPSRRGLNWGADGESFKSSSRILGSSHLGHR